MTVITISRQYGSGGDEIAGRLCEMLGFQHFDKRLVQQAAAQAGLSSQEVLDYSEENHKVRTFLDRLLGRGSPISQTRAWREDPSGVLVPEDIVLSEDILVDLIQKAIRSAHQVGNVVIVGRAGQIILKDQPDALHVRVEAPMEQRIQQVKEEIRQTSRMQNVDIELRRAAQDRIIERDAASADYIKRFYHADWDDPLLYHVVMNTGKVSIEQAVNLIVMLGRELPVLEKTPAAAG